MPPNNFFYIPQLGQTVRPLLHGELPELIGNLAAPPSGSCQEGLGTNPDARGVSGMTSLAWLH